MRRWWPADAALVACRYGVGGLPMRRWWPAAAALVACRCGVGGLPMRRWWPADAASVACPARRWWPARGGVGDLPGVASVASLALARPEVNAYGVSTCCI